MGRGRGAGGERAGRGRGGGGERGVGGERAGSGRGEGGEVIGHGTASAKRCEKTASKSPVVRPPDKCTGLKYVHDIASYREGQRRPQSFCLCVTHPVSLNVSQRGFVHTVLVYEKTKFQLSFFNNICKKN